jgi:hypothetical protein
MPVLEDLAANNNMVDLVGTCTFGHAIAGTNIFQHEFVN